MTNTLRFLSMLAMLLPFVLLALANAKANLKKPQRHKQFLMFFVAIVLCIVAMVFVSRVYDFLVAQVENWYEQVDQKVQTLEQMEDPPADPVELAKAQKLATWLETFIKERNLHFWAFYIVNAALLLAYVIVKKIAVVLMKALFRDGSLFNRLAGLFYEQDENTGEWSLQPKFSQARSFLKALYVIAIILGAVGVLLSSWLYLNQLLTAVYYPVFSVIILGELYFFLDGLTKKEKQSQLSGEADDAEHVSNYSIMCGILRRLFPDKLNAENTQVSDTLMDSTTNDELLTRLEQSENVAEEGYGRFMRRKSQEGMELDFNYLLSGRRLLCGQSVLFNNPFYYDLIPYIFYPMNRVLLRHKKVLVILGRHETEDTASKWCTEGLTAVTNIPSMWNVGVLDQEKKDLDVGIITRSSVHDLQLHEANKEFFDEVEFVVLMEPSRLVTTAQVGLNSLIRHCRRKKKQIAFCSMDKNCDGLLDALSHILMTSLQEVAATNHHKGASSYMIWEADGEHLQHRMLPNLSRYLGMGTELSFAALKNQIPQTSWYGGDAFPVVDQAWIVKQYYYDLLRYANLPANQETMERVFRVYPDLWSAPAAANQYITVEDESFNMFEIKRDFSTRATEQGFVNVICSDYLLKDYMADNDSIFNADPKAIPYITADYARTARNVVLRLCLRMSAGMVSEEEICRELTMIDRDTEKPVESLWQEICRNCGHMGKTEKDLDGRPMLRCHTSGKDVVFTGDVLLSKRRFNMDTGRMETVYFIKDSDFIKRMLSNLRPAEYVAEDENGERQYLGTELQGNVFQRHLPGQFFTFGGKYYEMLRVSSTGQVIVRRASDHIDGRPFYRQIRNYYISDAVDSEVMGDCRDMGVIRISRQFADIRVQTPAYWKMNRYNDFSTAKKVGINGVPERVYNHKALLRIDLNPRQDMPEGTVKTLTLLVNEVLRTLLAENQDYLVAVTAGQAQQPHCYSLFGNEEFQPQENSIYLIEDSQMDIGLLDAVERNLNRIFAIIWDYLQWHEEALAEKETKPEPIEIPDDGAYEEPEATGFWGKIKKFFKKIFSAIARFFKKLFGGKKKGEPQQPAQPVEPTEPIQPAAETEEIPVEQDAPEEQEAPVAEETPAVEEAPAKKKGGFLKGLFGRKKKKGASTEENQPETEPEVTQEPLQAEPETVQVPEQVTEPAGEVEQTAEASAAEEVPEEAPAEAAESADDTDQPPVLFSFRARFSEEVPAEGAPAEEPAEEEDSGEAVEAADGEENDTVEFEPEKVVDPSAIFRRLPYKQRYYLRYGSDELAATLQLAGVRDLLTQLGYANSALTQARKGKNVAEMVEKSFVPNREGVHYCDFCGCELTGLDVDILADGRERCPNCSRTVVKNLEEFVALHDAVLRNMKLFFGVKINAPVRVQMVNARKLHRKLGKTFIPTGKADGRILGVAIKDKSGYSILIENGAPKLQSTMTMVHEMTHIWQYLNWDARAIKRTYGSRELEAYEGMAKWVEIQYAYMLNETATAKREELITKQRKDPYGIGFLRYLNKYPLSIGPRNGEVTPFDNIDNPM